MPSSSEATISFSLIGSAVISISAVQLLVSPALTLAVSSAGGVSSCPVLSGASRFLSSRIRRMLEKSIALPVWFVIDAVAVIVSPDIGNCFESVMAPSAAFSSCCVNVRLASSILLPIASEDAVSFSSTGSSPTVKVMSFVMDCPASMIPLKGVTKLPPPPPPPEETPPTTVIFLLEARPPELKPPPLGSGRAAYSIKTSSLFVNLNSFIFTAASV